MARILVTSNGHGEDAIGARLACALRARGVEVAAFPIVGTGQAYRDARIPLIFAGEAMPSGGFVVRRPRALASDVRAGLLGLTLRQLAAMRLVSDRFDTLLAVGDIVVLGFAWWSTRPYHFVGCAKSDLYGGNSYGFVERLLMRHPRCRGVYPRDAATTAGLRSRGVAARDLGNPMVDAVGEAAPAWPDDGAVRVLILPGSRAEAAANFARLAEAARAIRAAAGDRRPTFAAALASPLAAVPPGWEPTPTGLAHPDGTVITWGAFAGLARAAHLALAMAGTATEQVVASGTPAIALPGPGPQFTAAFARDQARLLGESLIVLPDDPAQVAAACWALLNDPGRLARIATNGRARMGPPGGTERIAEAVFSGSSGQCLVMPAWLSSMNHGS